MKEDVYNASGHKWVIFGNGGRFVNHENNNANYTGLRPVITVLKSNIQ